MLLGTGIGYTWLFGSVVRDAIIATQNHDDINEIKGKIEQFFSENNETEEYLKTIYDEYCITKLEVWTSQNTPAYVSNLELDSTDNIEDYTEPLEMVLNFMCNDVVMCCYMKLASKRLLQENYNHILEGHGMGDVRWILL